MSNGYQETFQSKIKKIEELLEKYLPEETGYQKKVLEAMNYSLMAGGKRIRPMLMLEVYTIFGGEHEVIEPFMAAIEMIHTYSLVHDDLPAMDNDDYRRGRKTTHKVYGEALGILAGDGLLNYAFETALTAFDKPGPDWERVVKALVVLSRKAGVYGMIGGQTADMEAEEQTISLSREKLLYIHEKKTAALIQASMMIGAILAGASEEEIHKVEKCAYNIGIAFQIQDDILDITGDSRELGKPIGSDEKNHKQTYVTINGLEASKKEVAALSEEAIAILESFPGDYTFLKQLILMLMERRK